MFATGMQNVQFVQSDGDVSGRSFLLLNEDVRCRLCSHTAPLPVDEFPFGLCAVGGGNSPLFII